MKTNAGITLTFKGGNPPSYDPHRCQSRNIELYVCTSAVIPLKASQSFHTFSRSWLNPMANRGRADVDVQQPQLVGDLLCAVGGLG